MTPGAIDAETLKKARHGKYYATAMFVLGAICYLTLVVLDADAGATLAGLIGLLALLVGAHNAETRYQALKRESEGADGDRTEAAGSAPIG